MKLLTPIVPEGWLNLAPALLHTLWQAASIALLLGIALFLIPASRPRLRYGLSVASLIAVLAVAFLTLAFLDHHDESSPAVASANSSVEAAEAPADPRRPEMAAAAAAGTTPISATPLASRAEIDHRTVVLGIWLVGVLAMLGRLASSLQGADNLRRRCRPCPDQAHIDLLEELAARATSARRRVRLLIADHLESPVAMGVFWPVIIIPASLTTGVPTETLRAILAHEIAHIRRHDYLVNLGQLLIETVLFFNPAVWLISRWIRVEREACCDAMAAQLLDDEAAYAEALADYAQARGGLPAVALAFGHEKQPSTLADRVRRLLVPGYQPRVRLPLASLALFLVCGGILLGALHQGSRVAVEVGARLLTPEERIEKIQEIQKTHASSGESIYGNVTKDSPKVIIRGRVVDESGNLVTNRHLHARASTFGTGHNGIHAFNVRDGIVHDRIGPGEIRVAAFMEGYAPGFVGPLVGRPGDALTNLTFVLSKGITSRGRLVGPDGRGVPGAEIKGAYEFANYIPVPETVTDTNGVAVFSNTLTRVVTLKVRHPGFQFDEQEITLSGEATPEWRLHPAQPTLIRVVDREGAPVPNPRAALQSEAGFRSMSYGKGSARPLARGDESGLLRIDTLRDDSVYSLLIDADGYRRDLIHKVHAGETNRVFTLGPPIVVSGYFEGDPSQLKKRSVRQDGQWRNVPVVNYSITFGHADHMAYSHGDHAPVTIRDGRAYFTLTNLLSGELAIHGATEPFKAELTNSITGLRLILPERDMPTRTVRIELRPPAGHPPARGRLQLSIDHKTSGPYTRPEDRAVTIVDSAAELELAVGSKISVSPERFTGYWFPSLSHKTIEAGDGPQTFIIDCVPAGAIFGTITEEDGSPARSVAISVTVERKSARQRHYSKWSVKSSNAPRNHRAVFSAPPCRSAASTASLRIAVKPLRSARPSGLPRRNHCAR